MLTKHKRVAAVFLDIKKAFDSVPHQQLILALHCIRIQGPLFNWFQDYLTSRYQRVVLDGVSSDFIPVTSGVPQAGFHFGTSYFQYLHEFHLQCATAW